MIDTDDFNKRIVKTEKGQQILIVDHKLLKVDVMLPNDPVVQEHEIDIPTDEIKHTFEELKTKEAVIDKISNNMSFIDKNQDNENGNDGLQSEQKEVSND